MYGRYAAKVDLVHLTQGFALHFTVWLPTSRRYAAKILHTGAYRKTCLAILEWVIGYNSGFDHENTTTRKGIFWVQKLNFSASGPLRWGSFYWVGWATDGYRLDIDGEDSSIVLGPISIGKNGREFCSFFGLWIIGCLLLVPFRREQFQKELFAIVEWYNQFRPHTAIGGKTPDEVYNGLFPANRKPRFETRAAWPRASPCAVPQTLVKGHSGVRLELQVAVHKGKKHLPIVQVRRVA
jgi:hypothetical protein